VEHHPLYHHGQRTSQAITSVKAGGKQSFHATFLLGLSFDSKNAGDMFLQNIG
jgi:hypothetical protein